MDIKKCNISVEQYIKLRVDSIKSSQHLVAEKLLQVHNPYSNDPSEEWQKRKCKLFTKEKRMLVERFKSVVDYHKNITTTSQKQIAKEICLNSKVEI
ncbi:5786_t:CDS:2, partial [Entrophospora sp. SA101]